MGRAHMDLAQPVPAAVHALCRGGPVVLVDDLTPEQEGALLVAAAEVDVPTMAFLVRESSGVVCVAMTGERLDELRLPPLVAHGAGERASAFAVSVDLRVGVTTGISARDRALTAQALADPATGPADLVRPGHVLPLRARGGGVLEQARSAEAAVDLCRLAGLPPAGVLAAVANSDGTIAALPDVTALAQRHDLPLVRVSELVAWRRRTESPVRAGGRAELPTVHGRFRAVGYAGEGAEHIALVRGAVTDGAGPDGGQEPVPVYVHVHVECLTGDVLGSVRCSCAAQLDAALAAIDRAGRGVLVYLRGRHQPGSSLVHALRGCAARDDRDEAVAAHILHDVGVRSVVLLSDDPEEDVGLPPYGVSVTGVLPLVVPPVAAYVSAHP
jgi:3,4-dihydroxy 2-butanone 4-phosphate synthase/GTP cyclohydrolase II